jgi:hypothetical protein
MFHRFQTRSGNWKFERRTYRRLHLQLVRENHTGNRQAKLITKTTQSLRAGRNYTNALISLAKREWTLNKKVFVTIEQVVAHVQTSGFARGLEKLQVKVR